MAKQRGLSGAVSASKAASERSVKVVVVERATREESYRSKTVFGLDAYRTKIVSTYAQTIHIGGRKLQKFPAEP